MNYKKNINKYIVELYICNVLDVYGWKIGDVESQEEYVKLVEEIYDLLQDDKPKFPSKYIGKYLKLAEIEEKKKLLFNKI